MEKYPHGIEQIWIDDTHPVMMASPEKALCDYISLNRISGIDNAIEAEEFLESNLRIERTKWKIFDPIALQKLNHHYRNDTIKQITGVL